MLTMLPRSILLGPLLTALAVPTPAYALAVPSPFLSGARVDVNELGQGIVAWIGPGGVRAVGGDRTRALEAVSQLSTTKDIVFAPSVAIDDRGDAVVVWETARTVNPGCRACDPHRVSTGVWAALRRAGGPFEAPVALAPPVSSTLTRLADPRLAMSSNGDAVVAWSDAAGAVVSVRAAGAGFGASQLVVPGFSVRSVAISGQGEILLGDGDGRIVTGSGDGAFSAPQPQPGAVVASGDATRVAADTRGDALVAYRAAQGFLVSRRSAGGAWSAPDALAAAPGASLRAAVIADTGEGVVTWTQSGARTGVFSARVRAPGAPGTPAIARVTPGDLDAEMDFSGNGIDAAPTGDVAIGWDRYDFKDILFGRRVAQVAIGGPGGGYGAPVTLTPADGEHALGDSTDVALNSRGELLATWTDNHSGQSRVKARWLTAGVAGPVAVLDIAPIVQSLPPPVPIGHFAQVAVQTKVIPSRAGRVPVVLRCISSDGKACTGTVTLTSGSKKKVRAGRARFKISAQRSRRVYVQLTKGARSLVRRRGRLTLVATATTTKPEGPISRSQEQVFVSRR